MLNLNNLVGFGESLKKLAIAQRYKEELAPVIPNYTGILRDGVKIEFPDLMPTHANAKHPKTARKRNPSVTKLSGGIWGISDEVKEIVERFEPGVHQFFPLDITYPDGTNPPFRYNIMNIHRRVEALDFERSAANGCVIKDATRSFPYRRWSTSPKCVFRRSVVEGLHLWLEPGTAWEVIASDELVATFEKKQNQWVVKTRALHGLR